MMRFGYLPSVESVDAVTAEGDYKRALVLEESIDVLCDGVREVRSAEKSMIPGAESLPAGVYWFQGFEESLVMQVGAGTTSVSSELEFTDWDDVENHPLVRAYDWAAAFWEVAEPVPEAQFQVGEYAITVPGGIDVEIQSRSFDFGSWTYSVSGRGRREQFAEHKLKHAESSHDPEDWVLEQPATAARLGATLTRTKLRGQFVDTLYSFRATRTVFRPYQFKPVLKMLQTGRARILIADEVGLGKTIEAGLIWTELEARHEADRVLIVCPSALLGKWRDEMRERFGFELEHLKSDGLARFAEEHFDRRLPSRKAYITSLETLRTWKELEALADDPPDFDLIIVDEAHAMRNTSSKSYQLGLQLSEWSEGANMVFLSATPINLRETDLLHLLGLLEPADYVTADDLEARLAPNAVINRVGRLLTDPTAAASTFNNVMAGLDGLALETVIKSRPEFAELTELLGHAPLKPREIAGARRLLAGLNALSTTVTRTRRAEVDELKAVRDAEPGIEVVWSETESNFYNEYLKWCAARAEIVDLPMYFCMQMPIRLASSSVHAAAASVLALVEGQQESLDGDRSPDDEEKPAILPPSGELIQASRDVLTVPDSKLERLRHVLAELHGLGRQALLFTWSKAVLRQLKDALGSEYRIAVLNGDVPSMQRRVIMNDFRGGRYDFVFANRVASEGLDFEFCSAVINYDLPWNPMEIEQRIGRIDRIGQESSKILIRNFYNNEAIDSRILFKVLNRIEIFENSIGELEPIIGAHMNELHTAIDYSLTPAQQEAKAQQFLTAVEEQREGLRDIAESAASLVIADDVQVAGLESELESTGRYLGPIELANLIDDWAVLEGASRLVRSVDGRSAEIRGNTAMGARLNQLSQAGGRSRAETSRLASDLRDGLPFTIALDQELSRVTGMDLLNATHPLVVAAVDIPGHRSARFATVRIDATGDLQHGRYIVVLAHAINATRGGDEIWGAAAQADGTHSGSEPADALLAALARGHWREGSPPDSEALPRLVRQAKRQLERRHRETQQRRDLEDEALRESRRRILEEQHERRVAGIERRIETLRDRNVGVNVMRMARGQLQRQQDRYERMRAEILSKSPEAVSLEYLAVCWLEVV